MDIDPQEYDRLKEIKAAMREWFASNKAEDMPRWLLACRRMDALMGGTWEKEDGPLSECITFNELETL